MTNLSDPTLEDLDAIDVPLDDRTSVDGALREAIRDVIREELTDLGLPRLTYTVPEAAELLGVSRNTAYDAVRTGEIPSITVRAKLLVPRQALLALLDQRHG